jgi:CubicO group peptidase (beta-lactamase class C family)
MGSSSGLSSQRLGRIHDVLSEYVDRGVTPGAISVVSRREEVHIEAAGYLDLAARTPMKRDTIFRIASMTKAVTAVAAMILVEETKLRLDDRVDEWLPEITDRQVLRSLEGPVDDTVPAHRPITLRDLLTFRMGIGPIMAPPATYPIQAVLAEAGLAPGPIAPSLTNDEWMARLGSLPLLHQPGEKWMYHTGSDVAGVLISRVVGTNLGAFLKERIFDPLGMKDTGFSVPEAEIGRLATGYRRDRDGTLKVYDPAAGGRFAEPPKFEAGGGGLVSTAHDYLAFSRMLMAKGRYGGERILSRASVELMTSDQLTAEQKELSPFFPGFWDTDGWGFGVSVTNRTDAVGPGPRSYGWTGGFGTAWRNDPQEDMVTIYLNQRLMTGPGDLLVSTDLTTLAYAAIDD